MSTRASASNAEAGNTTTPRAALCFGELLWDFLPDGLFPGGAPYNASYHLHHHQIPVHLASAVGRDVLGDELVRRVEASGLSSKGIAHHTHLLTGYVRAVIGSTGDARYEIPLGVAWDTIPLNEGTRRAASQAGAFIFGSLAQRSAHNRIVLDRLLDFVPRDALRVFDVNLRAPHDDLILARALAARANVLKMNDEEIARLAGGTSSPGMEEQHARVLRKQTGCPLIVVTCGARGAGLLRDSQWIWEPGQPVHVVDTIGAGDAFLACLVAQLMTGNTSDSELLARACRLGEWVASQRGATPAYEQAVALANGGR